jgi:flagellin
VTGSANLDVQTTFNTAKGGASSMALQFSGAGFDDLAVSVNLSGVNDLNGLVEAINGGIAAAAAGTGAANTAFKNANISAAISEDGKSFTLNSSDAAFTVTEGDAVAARGFLGTLGTAATKVAGGLHSKAIAFTEYGANATQALTISTTDEAGAMHSVDITISRTAVLTADGVTDQINTQLQATGNATLMKLVAQESGNVTTSNEITIAGLRDFKVTMQAASAGTGLAGAGTTVDSAEVSGGGNVTILTEAAAKDAVTKLAEAVTKLGQAQAVVGKGQNQFNFAVSLATTQLTNLAASESRIRDADLALEAANLTKAQILQQAGIAALAQANSAPQAVLSLLRG